MSLPSVRNDSLNVAVPPGSQSLPKSRRLRKRAKFQRVYKEGTRLASAYFLAFFREAEASEPARAGLAVPRTLGKAVVRNRIKRRLREALRRHWSELPENCEVVIHARRPILDADWPSLEAEIQRVFQQAAKSRGSAPPK